MTGMDSTALTELTRKRDRQGDRTLLDEVLDTALVATLSTVLDGQPWAVPQLFARVDDRILLHGSTGAGALRHVAAGAPVVLSAFILDGLVLADTLFNHSANYRSATVRGTLTEVTTDAAELLTILSDRLVPGRSAEMPPHSAKDLAAIVTLALDITDDNWIVKARSGDPGVPDAPMWTGVVPTRMVYDDPITATGTEIPESVRRLRG
ncbi:pyridoxamine 5'-phosphate oxidase family protein [Williamsia sp. CHRR-6]|uniref:pyridoxamine 5'-phosphate oxidase family protein n=1 Tax=Williamsia sp. CHRR-6 TaxID=2835871 RepID=UPI001BDB27F5|nr:pyridoxamine 5'-phosphate oxidase family protein [Williamsia sp. CHRR-6]MBT0566186.1 pyridoxamine 5'-phosphate oxidase family protein [Williamsia sp. CHRR-6]